MPNYPTANNLGLAELEPALDTIAAALREHHPPELHVWAVIYLASKLGLGDVTVVGDPGDPEFTAELMLEAALTSRRRRYLGASEQS